MFPLRTCTVDAILLECVHTQNREERMDDILDRISRMDERELDRLQEAVKDRRRKLRAEQAQRSIVVAYRPHEDGYLQLEKRVYVNKKGKQSERGPYWYFRYHEGGRQRTMYLGKTDHPEGKLAEKREKGEL